MQCVSASASRRVYVPAAIKVLAGELVHVEITLRAERYFYNAFIPVFGKKCGKHYALHAQAVVNNTFRIAFIMAKGVKLSLAQAAVRRAKLRHYLHVVQGARQYLDTAYRVVVKQQAVYFAVVNAQVYEFGHYAVCGARGGMKAERAAIGHDARIQAGGNGFIYKAALAQLVYKVVYHFAGRAVACIAKSNHGIVIGLLVVVYHYKRHSEFFKLGRHGIAGAAQGIKIERKHKLGFL